MTCMMSFQPMYTDAALESCMSGTYMTRHGSGMDICDVCKPGTFMPEAAHTHRQCFNCSQIVDTSVEVIIQPCNISHDAIIQCVPGFYRRRVRNRNAKDECIRCSLCDKPTRQCMNYTDTLCCLPYHEAVHSFDDVYRCDERPCGYGQHFDEKTDQCVPCPENTYMPDNIHKHTSCLKCLHLKHSSAYNSRVFNNCTSSSPTIFGCVKEHYRNVTGEPFVLEALCSPCTPCPDNPIRNCSDFGDSICDRSEVMLRTPSKPVTNSSERRCFENFTRECGSCCVSCSQCESSNYPHDFFTTMPPEVNSPASIYIPVVIGLITIIFILAFVICFAYKRGCKIGKHVNRPEENEELRGTQTAI